MKYNTIHDLETGLIWEVDVNRLINWADACKRTYNLNSEKALGFSDWRMPTSEELEAFTKIRGMMKWKATIVWTSEHYKSAGSDSFYWTFNIENGDRKPYTRDCIFFAFSVRDSKASAKVEKTKQERIDSQVSFQTIEELRGWLSGSKE